MKRFLVRLLGYLLLVGAGAYGALALTARPVAAHRFFASLPQDRAVVVAHRGGADLWPENTIPAFTGALALGADILEMDVYSTADGIPVVIHDETVDRTTDGSGPVASFTLEELQVLDAAFHHPELRGSRVVVPALEEVFAAFPGVLMIVEVKENDTAVAQRVMDLVVQYNRVEQTMLGSFHYEVLEYVRRRDPRIATHMVEREIIPFLVASWLFSGHLVSPPAEALLVPTHAGILPVTTGRFISAAQRRGVWVAAWTINEEGQMRRLVNRGVQGLITDRPDLAVSVVREGRERGEGRQTR